MLALYSFQINCMTLLGCASLENIRLMFTLHYITLHYITSHHITSHRIASHRIASHRIASHRIASHRITSHHITSHHITSHHITSHHITLHYITLHYITLHFCLAGCSALDMEAILTSPTGKTELCEIRDQPGSLFIVKFTPNEKGLNILSLKIKGIHINGDVHVHNYSLAYLSTSFTCRVSLDKLIYANPIYFESSEYL